MRGGQNRMQFTDAQIGYMRTSRTNKELARMFGCSDMPIRRWRKQNSWIDPAGFANVIAPYTEQAKLGTPGRVDNEDGTSAVTSPPIRGGIGAVTDAEGYLRERWGFAVEDWVCERAVGNEWQGGDGEGGLVTYGQVKGTFRKAIDLVALVPTPATVVWPEALLDEGELDYSSDGSVPDVYIIEGDHQAPYHDPALDAATCQMYAYLRPLGAVFHGDIADYPTISKHNDHPAAMATVNECTQAATDILLRRIAASPSTGFFLMEGNHGWRLRAELLARAERLVGARTADIGDGNGRQELFSIERAMQLDALGVQYVSDPRGWQHAEVELVPGIAGLVVRHGWLTGAGTAEKSLAKRGRSIIVGHTHGPTHTYQWDPSAGVERQAHITGAMCLVRDQRFPHFAVLDGWLQGPTVVSVWPDTGAFVIERARWDAAEKTLYWRDMRWTA